MNYFMSIKKKNSGISYTRKDPLKHMHKIKRDYDALMCDDAALTHIEDSAKYIHDLRRKKR